MFKLPAFLKVTLDQKYLELVSKCVLIYDTSISLCVCVCASIYIWEIKSCLVKSKVFHKYIPLLCVCPLLKVKQVKVATGKIPMHVLHYKKMLNSVLQKLFIWINIDKTIRSPARSTNEAALKANDTRRPKWCPFSMGMQLGGKKP